MSWRQSHTEEGQHLRGKPLFRSRTQRDPVGSSVTPTAHHAVSQQTTARPSGWPKSARFVVIFPSRCVTSRPAHGLRSNHTNTYQYFLSDKSVIKLSSFTQCNNLIQHVCQLTRVSLSLTQSAWLSQILNLPLLVRIKKSSHYTSARIPSLEYHNYLRRDQ